jgi:hypothetical protein
MSTYPVRKQVEPFAGWMWCKDDTRWHVYPGESRRYLLWVERDRYDFHTFLFSPGGVRCPIAPIVLGAFAYCETPWTSLEEMLARREQEKRDIAEIRAKAARWRAENPS